MEIESLGFSAIHLFGKQKKKNRPKAVSHLKQLKRIKQLYGFLQLA
jgi:hypothetical protein